MDEAYRELSARYDTGEVDVAVRSSATAEDLPEASEVIFYFLVEPALELHRLVGMGVVPERARVRGSEIDRF